MLSLRTLSNLCVPGTFGRISKAAVAPVLHSRWFSTDDAPAAHQQTTKVESMTPDPFLVSLLARLQTEMPPLNKESVRAQEFWKYRKDNYSEIMAGRRNPWGMRDIMTAVLSRRLPVLLSLRLLAYNVALVLPFTWVISSHSHLLSSHLIAPGTSLSTTAPLFLPIPSVLSNALSLPETLHALFEAPPLWLIQSVEFLLDPASITAFSSLTSWLGAGMFLMLSFRINRATTRWWDALTRFYSLTVEIKSLMSGVHMWVKNDRQCADIGLLLFATLRSVEFQLYSYTDSQWSAYFTPLLRASQQTQGVQVLENPAQNAQFSDTHSVHGLVQHPAEDRPFVLTNCVALRLGYIFDQNQIPAGIRALCQMKTNLEKINEQIQSLQRIQRSPDCWTLQRHLRFTALVWLHIMPLSLVPHLGLLSIPLASLIGFVVIKMDDIGLEVQRPFGNDLSDIDVSSIVNSAQQYLRNAMVSHWQHSSIAQPSPATGTIAKPAQSDVLLP
jgi:predicted membrane chloride channel (bestrophin family)